MGMKIKHKGNFRHTEKFLDRVTKDEIYASLDRYGRLGVQMLAASTPSVSGVTAASWNYYVERTSEQSSIVWTNNHFGGTVPVVILLQYGHATGTGGYVQGYDFINPAMKDVFDQIAAEVWREVTTA